VSGTSSLGGDVTTSGNQTYTGATTLTSDVALNGGNGDILIASTLDGAQTFVANTTGTTTLGGAVGSTTALTSLTTNVGGTTAINGGSVTTTGDQVYNDAVTLGANTTLSGDALTFVSTVDGAHQLTTNSMTTTVFGASVGGNTVLDQLTATAGDSITIGENITTSGSIDILYGTSTNGSGYKLLLTDSTIQSTGGGAITLGANRTELDNNGTTGILQDISTGQFGATADSTIQNVGSGDVSILTNGGTITMGDFEKLTVGTGNLTLEATNMVLSDIAVAGDLTINAAGGTVEIFERSTGTSRFDDQSIVQDDSGTDIVAKGLLTLTADTVKGESDGTVQSLISIGAGTPQVLVSNTGSEIKVGPQVTTDIFTIGDSESYDYIATPANTELPFVEQTAIITVALEDEQISEALVEELLNLRIFARDLTDEEARTRRDDGYSIITQFIVDEAAPIDEYEVASPRISEQAASAAIALGMALFGEGNEGMEAISNAFSDAYQEFSARNSSEDPAVFAAYLNSSSTPKATAANEYAQRLNEFFSSIERIGITQTEANISRRNVLSRLRVEGLRGRDLIKFFDAYSASQQTSEMVAANK
ncbi:MAG: hypothetical protein ACSHYA_15290, partial [Opitutaceae bacterium]